MELIKKLFKSIFILFGIACMVVVVMLAIMMFGKVSIFGFSFINIRTGNRPVKIDIDTTTDAKLIDNNGTIESIIIKTDRCSPQIEYYGNKTSDGSASEGILIKLEYSLQGIAKGDTKTISLKSVEPSEVFDSATRTLTLETIEPEGLFFTNDCALRIYMPMQMKVKNVDIQVGNAKFVSINSNATKLVGESNYTIKQLQLDNLKITQTAPNYNGLTIGKIAEWTKSISSNNQDSDENLNLRVGNLTLNTVAGRVNVNCSVSGELKINSKSGTFVFERLTNKAGDTVYTSGIGGSVLIEGDVPSVELGTVSNKTIDLAKRGETFEIKKPFNVGGSITVVCNALVQVSGTVNDYVSLNGAGATLRANTINGSISAFTGSGGITVVGEAKGGINIGADDASVTISDVFINTAKSNIKINSNNKPVVINKLVNSNNCKIVSTNGDIVIRSIDANSTVDLEATNASITANFIGAIKDDNKIETKGGRNGNINVTFIDLQQFRLKTIARDKNNIKSDDRLIDTTNEPDGTVGGLVFYEAQICGHTGSTPSVTIKAEYGTINCDIAD